MCGIFGIYHANGQVPETARLQKMADVLDHRGPDDHGFVALPHSGIGNTRLAIIDVDHGKQPVQNAAGNIHLVQNGEIYNYVELKAELEALGADFKTHSDTEVLLHAYEFWGDDFVNKCNGMFAIAIADQRDNSLKLYRDRVGMKPLYIAQTANGFLFASEIKALLAAGLTAAPDFQAMHHFLSFNYIPAPFTMFEGVKALMPGEQITITPTGTNARRWWRLGEHTPANIPTNEAAICDDLRSLLETATQTHMRADVEVGAFLSGGVDSASVVGMASKQTSQPIKTFAIGFEEKAFDESEFALMASERFGTDHTMKRVKPGMLEHWPMAVYFCDQPHGDVSFMPTYEVAKLAHSKVKTVLTGDGGDELFAGYDKYVNFAETGFEPGWQRRYFENTSLLSHDEKCALYSDEMRAKFANTDSFNITEDWQNRYQTLDPINQILAFDTTYLLSGNNLIKPDRMSMATSLEGRMPFLDPSMIGYAFALPGHLKLQDGVTKSIMKRAYAPLIGDELAYRKKQMFTVPIGEWLKTSLAPTMQSLIGSNRFAARGLFSQQRVQHYMSTHIAGKENHTRILRALMAIELWFRIFIDSSELVEPNWQNIGLQLPDMQ